MKDILIVDDHPEARRAIRNVLMDAFGEPTVSEAGTLEAARQHVSTRPLDLVVLDLDLPDGRGETFIPAILDARPNAYVVVSTIHDESNRLLVALESGAKGYLLKEQYHDKLVADFQGILKGRPPLAPTVARRLLEFLRNRSDHGGRDADARPDSGLEVTGPKADLLEADTQLTKREEEVLIYLAKGFSRPEIAGLLNISKQTVATHVDKVYRKLDVTSKSEAAVMAEKLGLL